MGVNHLSRCFIKNSHHIVARKCLTPRAVVWDASFAPSLPVKMDEMGSLWERQRDKSMKDVRIHSQLWRTFITEQAGPVNVFSLHGPIYRTPVSKQSALSPVKKRHSRGKSSYPPSIPPPPPPPPSPRLIPDCEAGEARQKREESCLPSTAQESSMAARLMTPSPKVTKELLCTRARLWGLIELSSS